MAFVGEAGGICYKVVETDEEKDSVTKCFFDVFLEGKVSSSYLI